MKKDYKNMTDEEIDKKLEKLERTYQKACLLMSIQKEKPGYKPIHERRK